jgi:hypothetical protein
MQLALIRRLLFPVVVPTGAFALDYRPALHDAQEPEAAIGTETPD